MQKFDKRVERSVLRTLDGLVTKFGVRDAAHAINKWNKARLVRNAVEKERRSLRKRLAELHQKGA